MKLPRIIRVLKGFTLIELLVVIGIIALLASIALPAFSSVQLKAAQTKALNNAKQIGFACRAYASDNNDQYPSTYIESGSATSTPLANSNEAFNSLIPTYLATCVCFYQPGSAETPNTKPPPDPPFAGTSAAGSLGTILAPAAGANHWAYVPGLADTSNSSFPLITDNPASGAATSPTATVSQVLWSGTGGTGGVWKGKQAIVVHVDDSATIDQLSATYEDMNGPGTTDLFANGNSASNGWLGSGNALLGVATSGTGG